MVIPKAKTIASKLPMPHHNVFARLGPSKIHGIGVFAIRNIKKDTDIFPDIDDEIIWIDKARVKKLRGEIRRLYEYYCVIKDGRYGCPGSFNNINASWYLNHSYRPNLRLDNNYRLFADRNIKKGEELTLDYTTFMDIKIPASWK